MIGGGQNSTTISQTARAALAFILAARVRHDDRGMAREASVGRLIDRALNADGLDRDVATNALGEYGMKGSRLALCGVTQASRSLTCCGIRHVAAVTGARWVSWTGAVSHDKMRFSAAMRLRCGGAYGSGAGR